MGRSTRHIGGRVPTDLADAFEQFAEQEERSVSAELRRAMRTHLTLNASPPHTSQEPPHERTA
jgi:hypothetical protein